MSDKPDIWLLCAESNKEDLRECAVAVLDGWKCDEDWQYVPVERIEQLQQERDDWEVRYCSQGNYKLLYDAQNLILSHPSNELAKQVVELQQENERLRGRMAYLSGSLDFAGTLNAGVACKSRLEELANEARGWAEQPENSEP